MLKNTMAYYPYWVSDRYTPDMIPFSKLTHLFHAFVRQLPDGGLSIDKGFIKPELSKLAKDNNCKLILSLGGGAAWSSGLEALSAKKDTRMAYIKSIAEFCKKQGYVGVDVDWEFPRSEEDKKNHAMLMKDFREYLGADYIVTMAIGNTEFKNLYIDFKEIDKYVDFYNLMYYDSHGPWGTHAGHVAPLYRGKDSCPYNCEDMLDWMNKELSLKNEKLALGVPFYGYRFDKINNFYEGGADCTGAHVLYKDIPKMIGNGWTRTFDAECRVPYLVKDKGTGILSYDDPESIREKIKWAEAKGLFGVFTWEITQDRMKDGSQPLLEAMAGR